MSITTFLTGTPDTAPVVASTAPLTPPAASAPAIPSGAPLSLGTVDFEDFAVPEDVKFGSTQNITEHRLIGGKKVYDSNGGEDKPISWSGLFLSTDADTKAAQLKAMAEAGRTVILAWGSYNYSVIVKDVDLTYKLNRIAYSITCLVKSASPAAASSPSLLQSVQSDVSNANTTVTNAAIGTQITNTNSSLTGLTSLPGSSSVQTTNLLQGLTFTQSAIQLQMQAASNTIFQLGSLGGEATTTQTIAALSRASAALASFENLAQVGSLVGRATNNVTNGGIY